MGPPIYIGGNGSTNRTLMPKRPASMGPPIYIGGNPVADVDHAAPLIRFNGATDLHRWKLRPRAVGLMGYGFRFNGATDLHRWKRAGKGSARSTLPCASMGPPIYIGGNSSFYNSPFL